VYEPEKIMGKSMMQNLMNLTKDVKRQNIKIKFEVIDVQNGKAFTKIIGYQMVASSIRRMVRRNIEKIDMSFLCSTADKKNLRLKPLLITRSATSGSVAARLRKEAQEFLTKYIEGVSYDNFINDLISHKLQSSLRNHLKKVYPLRLCEIRSMEVLKLGKKEEAKGKSTAVKMEPKPEETKEEAKGKTKIDKKELRSEEKTEEGKHTKEAKEKVKPESLAT